MAYLWRTLSGRAPLKRYQLTTTPHPTDHVTQSYNLLHKDAFNKEEKRDTYSYAVNVFDIAVINAGPIVFNSNYRNIRNEDMLKKQPTVSVKWIDNDTIEINGEAFNIEP